MAGDRASNQPNGDSDDVGGYRLGHRILMAAIVDALVAADSDTDRASHHRPSDPAADGTPADLSLRLIGATSDGHDADQKRESRARRGH
jgi:hypothetical protein